ncbi:MAG: DUF4476 domain-containing protein [Bacteroidia bacterium]
MKSIITILTFLVFSITSTQVKASNLYLRTASGGYAQVNISGELFNVSGGSIAINDLRPGNHFITVRQRVNHRHRNHRGYRYREMNHRRGSMRTVYKGRIHLPARSTVYARLTPRGHLVIERTVRHRPNRRKHNPRYDRRDRRDWDRNDRDWDRGDRNRNRNRGDRRGGNYGNASSFDALLGVMNNASFDGDKLSIAQQYVQSNGVTSVQVLQMADAMDFETNKLAFAKYAYQYTVDPENYFMVNKTFDFSSSIRSLNNFIK